MAVSRDMSKCCLVEALKQDLAGCCVEFDIDTRNTAEAGRNHLKAVIAKNAQRGVAVEFAHGGTRRLIDNEQDVGAPEKLDLHFIPACTEGIELGGKIANREVHVTTAGGAATVSRRLGRIRRQHGMAESADAQARNEEGDADTGTEQGAQDRRPCDQVRFTGLHVDFRQSGPRTPVSTARILHRGRRACR